MGKKLEIPSDLLEFGGLKVAMQNSLSYLIDTVGGRGSVAKDTLWDAATVVANGSQTMANVDGGSYLLVRWNVTAITITTGDLFFLLEKRLPNEADWTTILSRPITATEHFMAQVSATPDATSDLVAVATFPATNTVLNGPWDTLRMQIYGTGTFSVTLTADYMVY